MDLFWKCAAGVLTAAILGLVLGGQEKGIGVLLSMSVCAMCAVILLRYLEPVLDLFRELEDLSSLSGDMLAILMKAMGIGLVGELASAICTDAGNGTLGKTMQMLASAAILWLAIPLFQTFLALIQQILGEA
jgi:stage III sporulation protein AD